MQPYSPGNSAWYALRRTLPPWSWERNLEELLAFCRDSLVDEVIVKVDTEEFSHNQVPLEWLEGYLPALQTIADALREAGVYYSLNPWITVGHLDRGRDCRPLFPGVQMMVGHDGGECHACACPLSGPWREHTRALWGRYAQTYPTVVWVEDDIRTFNHTPITYGCFCPLHLAAFGEEVGETVTREQLVAALLAPGEPHPWREVWLDMQGRVMVEVAAFLADTVQSVDPAIMLGLMSSGPGVHCLEGRRWHDFAAALQGTAPALCSRPPLGIYAESSLRDFHYGAASIRKTRRALPLGMIEQTEVENVPFSTFSKSAAMTALQLAVSHAMGCHGVTMNLYDHLGNPLADTPEYGPMLARQKPFLNALAQRSDPGAPFRGIKLLQSERASYSRRLAPGARYHALGDDGMAWAYPLEALGFAVTWDAAPAAVSALSGQTARALPEDALEGMLSRGLLLDLSALRTLTDMGLGEDVGATIAEVRPIHQYAPVAAEALTDPDFGGAPDRYLTATVPGLATDAALGLLDLFPGARAVSHLVDMDRREVCPLLTVFQNPRGGRVAILPYDMGGVGFSPTFLHPYRRAQLRAVLEWLARGPLPMVVEGGAYALPFRSDEVGHTRLTVFTLSLDPWEQTRVLLDPDGRAVHSVEFLCECDEWVTVSDHTVSLTAEGYLQIRHDLPLTYQRPAAWCVNWEG